MNILLFSLPRRSPSAGDIRRIFDAAERHGFTCAVNEEFAAEAAALAGRTIPPERIYGAEACVHGTEALMVSYGGDGTLLEGAHRLHGAPVPIVGINSGHLGFLTTVPTAGIGQLFDDIAAGRIRTEARTQIEVGGDFDRTPDSPLALNEFSATVRE